VDALAVVAADVCDVREILGAVFGTHLCTQDIDDIADLLRRLEPYQVYVAGELSDPHGTHRVCAEAVFDAVRVVRAEWPNERPGAPQDCPHHRRWPDSADARRR